VLISILTGALPALGTRTVRSAPSAVVIILMSNSSLLSKPALAMLRPPANITSDPPFVVMQGQSD
jgi:hypothetical protein